MFVCNVEIMEPSQSLIPSLVWFERRIMSTTSGVARSMCRCLMAASKPLASLLKGQ